MLARRSGEVFSGKSAGILGFYVRSQFRFLINSEYAAVPLEIAKASSAVQLAQ